MCTELLFSWLGKVEPPCLVSRQLHSLPGVASLPESHGEARLSGISRAFLTWINRLQSPGRSSADYCFVTGRVTLAFIPQPLGYITCLGTGKLNCSFPNLACLLLPSPRNFVCSAQTRTHLAKKYSALPPDVGQHLQQQGQAGRKVLILVQGSWHSPGRNMLGPVPKSLSNMTYDT